jgi:hypothetical protein
MAADDNRPVGLAGLIVACLDSPERRRHEDRLLEIYHSVDRARRRRLPLWVALTTLPARHRPPRRETPTARNLLAA